MNRVNERLSMNDPRHYQETHDFCQETKKKSKSRNLLQQRLDETIGKSIKEEKQRKIPSPFFLKEESLTDQEASLEETEKDSKFVWENDLEIKELETAYKEESAEKRYRRLTQGVNLLIILLCIYTGFLIFGVAVTQYHYSDNGTIEAQKLSVSDIREKKEYEKILAQYINLRTIYQSVLLLDYQYDQNANISKYKTPSAFAKGMYSYMNRMNVQVGKNKVAFIAGYREKEMNYWEVIYITPIPLPL